MEIHIFLVLFIYCKCQVFAVITAGRSRKNQLPYMSHCSEVVTVTYRGSKQPIYSSSANAKVKHPESYLHHGNVF